MRHSIIFVCLVSILALARRSAIARVVILISLAFSLKVPANAAARSVHVIIKNDTDKNMTFVSGNANHGIVTKNPPSQIPASGVGELFAESDGVMTGTEGTVTYRLDGINGGVSFHWDNPFYGSNSADGSAPAGFQVQQIGDSGNRTLVFFSIHAAGRDVAICNPDWVISHLGTKAEDALNDADKAIGFLTTPFKRMGVGGWVDTGCVASAEGQPVRDAQHSTDDFWTIDVELDQFMINGRKIPASLQPFVRIEVEPNTPAHARAAAKAGSLIRFHGHVLIDTHHGEELIEVHPWDPIITALPPTAPVLTASAPDARQIVLTWSVSADEWITRTVVERDGRTYTDNATAIARVNDGEVRPNTEYQYRVCLSNQVGTTCSVRLTTMAKPIAPTALADVTISKNRVPSNRMKGGVGAAAVTLRTMISASWRKTVYPPDIPGQFITVEREDQVLQGAKGSAGPNRLQRFGPSWIEIKRIKAKGDPTDVVVDITSDRPEPAIKPGNNYRVCAVVPALGAAGKVCSSPTILQ